MVHAASRGLEPLCAYHELERREGEVDLVGMVLVDEGYACPAGDDHLALARRQVAEQQLDQRPVGWHIAWGGQGRGG